MSEQPLTPYERFQVASGLAIWVLPLLGLLIFLGLIYGWQAVVLGLASMLLIAAAGCEAWSAHDRLERERLAVRLEDVLR